MQETVVVYIGDNQTDLVDVRVNQNVVGGVGVAKLRHHVAQRIAYHRGEIREQLHCKPGGGAFRTGGTVGIGKPQYDVFYSHIVFSSNFIISSAARARALLRYSLFIIQYSLFT